MAPPKRPWFRFYVEAIWDRKLRRLSPTHRWLWVTLLALARSSCSPGVLILSEREPLSLEDIADASAVKPADVKSGMAQFETLGLIERDENLDCWVVAKWNERQYETDTSTDRTTKHRSKNGDATAMQRPIDVDATPPETEADTDTEPEVKTLAPKARKRNHLFDAVAEVCGINPSELTNSYKGAFGKAVKDLAAVGATPDDVHFRASNWPTLFADATLTPPALAKHWAQLAQPRAPAARSDRFVDMGTRLNNRLQQRREEGTNGQLGSGTDETRRGFSQG